MCQSCGARFYDLNRKDAACPKCGTSYEAEKPAKSRRPSPPAAEAVVAEAPAKAVAAAVVTGIDDGEDLAVVKLDDNVRIEDLEDAAEDIEDTDDDDDLIEDASDLGEDDDDMSEVREHVDNGTEDRA
jgi:uncharacterized protein (TIGR02300 family)